MESNYASAVIYIDDSINSTKTAEEIAVALKELFKTYEIVLVDDECKTDIINKLISALKGHPVSIVKMGNAQGLEASMNAGIDAAIGDYVYEIDDLKAIDPNFISEAYKEAMSGVDVVNGVFLSGSSLRGRLFYATFNRFSKYPTGLSSNPGRLVSRRAINRIRSMSPFAPYRKASYAASGLKVSELGVSGRPSRHTNMGMSITSLALYTNAFYKIAWWLIAIMIVLSIAEIIYVAVIAASGVAVAGWVTTMLVLTVGLLGVFILLSFVLKYLDILVHIAFNKQQYLTDGIERPDGNE